MKKLISSSVFWLTLIIIIASFLRLYNISHLPPGLYPDEAMNGNNALEAISTNNYKVFYPENNGREGMFINIQALSVAAFGNEPWALRIISSFFGIFTVLGIYFLTKEFLSFGKNDLLEKIKIALFSTFLIATSFWHIMFSRIGFRAIMAPFFSVWAIYFLLKSLRQIKESFNAKYFMLNSILGGVFFGLGFNSYIAYRAMPALIFVILVFWWWQNKAEWKKLIFTACLFTLVSVLMALPLGLYYLKNPADFMGRTTQVSIFSSENPIGNLALNTVKTLGMFNFVGDWNFRHNDSGKPELFWPIGIFLIIGIILSLKNLISKIKNREQSISPSLSTYAFLFSWLLIAALPVVVSNEGIPHALRAIIMIPPIFILCGIGGVYLYEFLKSKIVSGSNNKLSFMFNALCFTILVLIAINGYKSYFIDWGKNPNVQDAFAADYVQIGHELNALPKETPKYVVVPTGGVLVRGIPMPSQTVMFITDTFTPEKQIAKNIHYILPNQTSQIPAGAPTFYLK